jgi:hypothetical protein
MCENGTGVSGSRRIRKSFSQSEFGNVAPFWENSAENLF